MNELKKICQFVLQSNLYERRTPPDAQRINVCDVYFSIDIVYRKTRHRIQLIKDANAAKWILSPYKDSFFATKATAFGIDMILQAMQDHVELHRAKWYNHL